MADPTPPEDEIRKSDLWDRIGYTRDVIEKLRGELGTQVEAAKEFMIDELTRKIMENQDTMDKFNQELEVKMKEFRVQFYALSEETLAALGRKLDENLGKIEQKFTALQNEVYKKIDDSSLSFSKETKDSLTNAKKELEIVQTNAISGIQAKVTDMRRYVDTRLSGLDEATIKKAEVTVGNILSDLTSKAKEMEIALEACRKETSEAMTRFQSETMSKVSRMNDLFSGVQSKFSLIAESLKGQ